MAGYGSNDGFTAYAAAAGYTVPVGDVGHARQRGSAYIDATYGHRFTGVPTGGIEQDREWPRTSATDRNGNSVSGIPTRVINASYEAALLELTTPGSLSVVVKANERTKRAKAGPVEVEYFDNQSDEAAWKASVPVVSRIEGLLYPLLSTSRELPAILVV